MQNPLLSAMATFLAKHGVAPGASLSVADAALVTEDHLAARGDTLFIRRLPATSNACGRLMAEAVAHNTWDEVGVLAHTQPPQHRPATSSQASEGEGTRSGTLSRAVVLHSSAQDKRRQQRLDRALQASESPRQTSAPLAEQQAYCCRADAAAAAAQLRTVPTASPLMAVTVAERPLESRGRPRSTTPRAVKALRERLKTTVGIQTERMARLQEEAGCFVLRTNGPTAGDVAHSARDLLTVSKEHHGTEQHDGFLKAPGLVNRLFLKKPERLEALGRLFLLALFRWRLMARAMRTAVDTTSTPLTGWEKQATERPTSFMMVTKCAGVIVVKLGDHRQLARPLSGVQQQSLTARNVPVACFTDGTSGEGGGDVCSPPLTAAQAYAALVGRRPPADAREDHEQPPGTGARLAKRPGQEQSEPPDLGRAGLDGHWALVWWESRIPEAHPRGSETGLPICRKV